MDPFDALDDLPMESERENNGSPLMWLGLAVALLVVSAIVIMAIQRSDSSGLATQSSQLDGEVASDVDGQSEAGSTPVTEADSPPDEGADVVDGSAANAESASEPISPDRGPIIAGQAAIVVTANDFEIALSTPACATVDWSFVGDGQSQTYAGTTECLVDHVLSPQSEHPLLPDTSYEVTASFTADGVTAVESFTIQTDGE